jgi:hypothetical protein
MIIKFIIYSYFASLLNCLAPAAWLRVGAVAFTWSHLEISTEVRGEGRPETFIYNPTADLILEPGLVLVLLASLNDLQNLHSLFCAK